VTATAAEGGTSASSTTQDIVVTVNPVADAATLAVTGTATVDEDNSVALTITPTFETDPDATNTTEVGRKSRNAAVFSSPLLGSYRRPKLELRSPSQSYNNVTDGSSGLPCGCAFVVPIMNTDNRAASEAGTFLVA
jgi:hypothetical protein